MSKKKKLVVLSGAGISAESGIRTFRDSDGLWEQYHISDVATYDAWKRNPELVLRFYNERRRQLLTVLPNEGHRRLAELEADFEVHIITQNVDDLHERAGSSQVLHLHGELRKVRSVAHAHLVYAWDKDLQWGDCCARGAQLRPHIVWFGEEVPALYDAARIAQQADIFVVIGTSLQVYPAAGLMAYAPPDIPMFYIDPNPQLNWEMTQVKNLTVIAKPATIGTAMLQRYLGNVER